MLVGNFISILSENSLEFSFIQSNFDWSEFFNVDYYQCRHKNERSGEIRYIKIMIIKNIKKYTIPEKKITA